MSNSEEEKIARNQICFSNSDVIVVILDATCLERSLNLAFQILETTKKVVICVNLLDEAEKKGIQINLKELERILGVPVVGTIAKKKKTLKLLLEKIINLCENEPQIKPKKIQYTPIIEECVEKIEKKIEQLNLYNKDLNRWLALKFIDGDTEIIKDIETNMNINSKEILEINILINEILEHNGIQQSEIKDMMISNIIFMSENLFKDIVKLEKTDYNKRDKAIDKILTSKILGIPIMILFLGLILWITIVGANYPSQLLSHLFTILEEKLIWLLQNINLPEWINELLVDGIYKTVTWIIAVMLPPMAIFFPLFTILEDLGFLPRIAFNLDGILKKAGTSRKASTNHVHGIWM